MCRQNHIEVIPKSTKNLINDFLFLKRCKSQWKPIGLLKNTSRLTGSAVRQPGVLECCAPRPRFRYMHTSTINPMNAKLSSFLTHINFILILFEDKLIEFLQ